MKILTTQQVRQADQFTIENEPIASIDLMERASRAFTNWYIDHVEKKQTLVVVGIGNNGGDGLAVARMLIETGYPIEVAYVGDLEKASEDFRINWERLAPFGKRLKPFSAVGEFEVVIDAIFGSGLSRPASGRYAEVIRAINQSKVRVIAIDIPSGLFAEHHTTSGEVIEANEVVCFQFPKLIFMLPESNRFVKDWHVVDIGLDGQFIQSVSTDYHLIDAEMIAAIFKKRPRFFHKGDAGRALLVTGSLGKMGASVLCSRSCLRAGIGLLTVHVPSVGNQILQTSVPEAMLALDEHSDHISESFQVDTYDVIGIGPGIGTDQSTFVSLKEYLENYKKPMVLDADALNIMSENPVLLNLLPEGSILTPHPGEFRRLVGDSSDDFERLEKQRTFAMNHKVIVVLKNAHTSIALPDGKSLL